MARRGRPAFKVTAAIGRKVEELVSGGMSQDAIAAAIGCTAPTLVKYFQAELTTGLAKKRAEVIAMLYRAARGGNVSAQKKLEEMSRLAGAAAEFDTPPPKQPKRGKKEEAAAAAQVAGDGGEWGDDLRVPATPLN